MIHQKQILSKYCSDFNISSRSISSRTSGPIKSNMSFNDSLPLSAYTGKQNESWASDKQYSLLGHESNKKKKTHRGKSKLNRRIGQEQTLPKKRKPQELEKPQKPVLPVQKPLKQEPIQIVKPIVKQQKQIKNVQIDIMACIGKALLMELVGARESLPNFVRISAWIWANLFKDARSLGPNLILVQALKFTAARYTILN